jgi:hypothetical protein
MPEPAPRCPKCESPVPLRELWRAAPTNRGNILVGGIGVICPGCSSVLRVGQLRARLFVLSMLIGVPLLFVFWLKEFRPSETTAGFIGLGLLFTVVGMVSVMVPRLAVLKLADSDNTLIFPLGPHTK